MNEENLTYNTFWYLDLEKQDLTNLAMLVTKYIAAAYKMYLFTNKPLHFWREHLKTF